MIGTYADSKFNISVTFQSPFSNVSSSLKSSSRENSGGATSTQSISDSISRTPNA